MISYPTPKEVFARQIQCLVSGNPRGQLDFMADDCVWEFPFTPQGEPLRLEGRAQIEQVLGSFWDNAAALGAPRPNYAEREVRQTADPEVIVAEFDLTTAGKTVKFISVLRARAGRLQELREYFDPRLIG